MIFALFTMIVILKIIEKKSFAKSNVLNATSL